MSRNESSVTMTEIHGHDAEIGGHDAPKYALSVLSLLSQNLSFDLEGQCDGGG
jgi:hypothetical protein